MTQITARVSNEVVEELDEEAEKRDETRADRLRNIIHSRHESDRLRTKVEELQSEVNKHRQEVTRLRDEVTLHQNEVENLREDRERFQSEISDLETEVQRLNRERRQLLEQREENQELVKFAEEQRSLEHRRADREERRLQANIVRRGWWWLTGEPTFETADS